MKMGRCLLGVVVMWCASSGLAQPPAEPPKTPDAAEKPKAPRLYRDAVATFTQYERETLVEAYKKAGSRSERWNAAAIEFLKLAVIDGADVFNQPDRTELFKIGKKALDLGCDDPMVRSVYASALTGTDHPASALPLLQSSADGLLGSKYCKFRQAMAFSRLGQNLAKNKSKAEGEAALAKSADLFAAALTDPEEPKIPVRHAALRLRGRVMDVYSPLLAEGFLRRLEEAKVDPWLVHDLWSSYHHRLAWDARGRGFANTVTEEGWKEFEKHIVQERDHCEAAYALRPDLPEVCAVMIEVVRNGHAREGQDIWLWFDRCVAAEFDYPAAYNTMLFTLRPRWGGDHQQMLAFGARCAQTARYDTDVPLQFIAALEEICDDQADYSRVWRLPAVFDTAKKVIEGTIAARPAEAGKLRSLLAAIAWRCGKYEDLKTQLGLIKDKLDGTALWRFRVPEFEMVNAAALYTSPVAGLYKEADIATGLGNWNKALELCQRAYDTGPKDADVPFKSAAAIRLADARFNVQFHLGKGADLTFELDRPMWIPLRGAWTRVSDTAARGTPGTDGLMTLLHPRVGKRFHLTGTLTFVGATDPAKQNAGAFFGFETESVETGRWIGATVFPGAQKAGMAIGWPPRGEHNTPAANGPVQFELTCVDDSAVLRINGDEVFRGPFPKRSRWTPGDAIGLGGNYRDGNGSVEFSNLRVRKVDALPDEAPRKPKF